MNLLRMRQRLSQRCREFWRVEHHALDLARQIADLLALLYRHALRRIGQLESAALDILQDLPFPLRGSNGHG